MLAELPTGFLTQRRVFSPDVSLRFVLIPSFFSPMFLSCQNVCSERAKVREVAFLVSPFPSLPSPYSVFESVADVAGCGSYPTIRWFSFCFLLSIPNIYIFNFIYIFFFLALIFNWLQYCSWKAPPLESPAYSAESCSCFHKQFDV